MADENTYEDGDFEDGMEDEDMAHDALLDEEEEIVDIEIGEEIPLTHDEVWDDSELIDAWDRAVKQYEVYHSKTNKDTRIPTTAPSKTNIAKDNTISAGIASTKRARTDALGDSSSGKKAATESNVKSVRDQPQKQNASSSSDYAVSERKPSFKKAEKSGFGHYKARQQGSNDNNNGISGTGAIAGNKGYNTNIKSNGAQSTKSRAAPSMSRPKSSAQASTPPVYDAETIEYYRQMGYSYDPDYSASAEQESEAQEEEESAAVGIDDEEVRQPASTQRDRRPASRAASQSGTAARAIPPYPYPHSFGHYPGNSPHIPTPQGMPRMPNMPGGSGWGRSASVPFGLNAGGHAHAQFSYPGGMMPPQPPPPPPTMPMIPPMAGSFAGGNPMDEEALGNLIMAWYYSGYYTGLYQASQRR